MVNPFLAYVPISYPLETSENQRFSEFLRWYKMGIFAKNGLIIQGEMSDLGESNIIPVFSLLVFEYKTYVNLFLFATSKDLTTVSESSIYEGRYVDLTRSHS